MAKYSDEFRATAIAMLMGAGYLANKSKAVEQVERYYKGAVPKRTLFRWGSGENSPAPAKLVTEKKEELADIFERVARTYLLHSEHQDVVDEVSGNAAVITAATAVDKMRLLKGLPTEIVGIVTPLVGALQEAGLDPAQVFRDMIDELGKARLENAGASDVGAGAGARGG